MRSSRRLLILVLSLLALGVMLNGMGSVILWHSQALLVQKNCESIHRVVESGVRILNTPANLSRAYAAGKITAAEYRASLAQIHRFDPLRRQNVADWRKADCQP